jgi:hypothetical protein
MISIKDSLDRLFTYCQNQDWCGYDPYDGLNSKIFQALPLCKKSRFARLAFQQVNKRSIVNLRPLFMVAKGRNPKGIGLFLCAVTNVSRLNNNGEYRQLISKFIDWLKEDVSSGYEGDCWGYNFDWQSRAFFLPQGTPTVVNTSFISRGILNAYRLTQKEEYLRIARSSCDFILKDLNRMQGHNGFCFSYSPLDHYYVHNATALASSLLAGVYTETGEDSLAQEAKLSVQYVIDHQKENGAWSYGEDAVAQKTGVDNFHTGFILESLKIYSESTKDMDCVPNIRRGLDFYQKNFFCENGAPKYFAEKMYPFDIHSAAQAVITLTQLKAYGADQELCHRVLSWMINTMQDHKGYFYYQKAKHLTNKIPYIRWSQAWASHALATYLVSNAS